MKPEIKEFYDLYAIGQKVLTGHRTRHYKGWEPSVVDGKELDQTARIRTRETTTGSIYYTLFGQRQLLKYACQADGCWKEAISCGKETTEWFCVDHCKERGEAGWLESE